MYQFPIGVIVDSFRLPLEEAIAAAAKLGVQGMQMYATYGATSPEEMDAAKRRELRKLVQEGYGLKFSALCGDLGRGFTDPELNPQLVEKSKRIVDLALDLGTNIVTTHIGVVPEDPNHPRFEIMAKACRELAEYADSVGAHFAVETGPEPAAVLRRFLDSLNSKGVSVNFDPANLAMCIGEDPAESVYILKDYIVHTHAKDGVMIRRDDPNHIYASVPLPDDIGEDEAYRELPLGTGAVNFPKYLKALDDVGYKGFLTIEREVGDNPAADIAMAVDFLRKTIKEG